MQNTTTTKKGYLRSRGWKDLIFLAVLALLAFLFRRQIFGLSDFEKWQARPQLNASVVSEADPPLGQSGRPPCFFLVPSGISDQPVASGSVQDCILLVPDGRKLDFFEVLGAGAALLHIKTDLYVPDTMPLAFTRVMTPLTAWNKRFQIYLPNVYDPFLTGSRNPYTYLDWSLPDQESIHYARISPGTSFANAVYEYARPGSVFSGSRIKWNGWGWDLALKQGLTYLSPEAYYGQRPQQGSLVGIFDKDGHEVRLSRKKNGDLTEIKSPGGRWIRLDYTGGFLSRIGADSGNAANYQYDSTDRLSGVTYSSGTSMQYSYNSQGQLTRVVTSSGGTVVWATYQAVQGVHSSSSAVQNLWMDGRIYSFQIVIDKPADRAQWIITGPQQETTYVDIRFTPSGEIFYTVKKISSSASH